MVLVNSHEISRGSCYLGICSTNLDKKKKQDYNFLWCSFSKAYVIFIKYFLKPLTLNFISLDVSRFAHH